MFQSYIMNLSYAILGPGGVDPTVFDDESPGIDLYCPRYTVVEPGQQVKIDTCVGFQFPPGKIGLVLDKSSVVTRKQLKTEAGVIDTGYRGSVVVVLRNMSRDQTAYIQPREAIAQMILTTAWQPVLTRVGNEWSTQTHRGTRGFGGHE